MLIVQSSSLDIYRNLAVEEYLMENLPDACPILFLWQSEGAVVIGKNQNPWLECRVDRMREDGVALARRISGGGTVYHDLGNLNYCIIVDRTRYQEELAFELITQALATLGVHAHKCGKSNLCIGNRKFSGNAFCFRRNRALHHGTLLLDTDLVQLNRYLGPSFAGIKTRAIPSIPAEVVNLGLDVSAVSAAVGAQFKALYGAGQATRCATDTDFPEVAMALLIEKQRSVEWLYRSTPMFSVEMGGACVRIVKGRVVEAEEGAVRHLKGAEFLIKEFLL